MRMKRRLCALVLLCVWVFCACGNTDTSGGLPDPGAELARIVFFDAGSADAILIRTEQSAVLVDTGLEEDADALVEALDAEGVSALDALIITHFDKDHVGGAARLIESMPVGQVYEPDYEKDSKPFRAYRSALDAAGLNPLTLRENASFTLDGARCDIDVADGSFGGQYEENDLSLVIRLTVGEARALLAGDAENPRLGELLGKGGLKSDLLKVPHHGGYEKLSPAFFAAVGARNAVITSSEAEPEDADTVRALKAAGAAVWLTREGAVTARTDGTDWALAQDRP